VVDEGLQVQDPRQLLPLMLYGPTANSRRSPRSWRPQDVHPPHPRGQAWPRIQRRRHYIRCPCSREEVVVVLAAPDVVPGSGGAVGGRDWKNHGGHQEWQGQGLMRWERGGPAHAARRGSGSSTGQVHR